MSQAPAHLTRLHVNNFKSYFGLTMLELKPLTVLLGRNNSGKSTLIQALLLLKQTLDDPRRELQLSLEGDVEALDLEELTHQRAQSPYKDYGPDITVAWTSSLDLKAAHATAKRPRLEALAATLGLDWLNDEALPPRTTKASLRLITTRVAQEPIFRIVITSQPDGAPKPLMLSLVAIDGGWSVRWRGIDNELRYCNHIAVELDHFIPYLSIDRRNAGPRHKDRDAYNAYLLLFAQPLEALKQLLGSLRYLNSARDSPPAIYRTPSSPPKDIGTSGQYAAQLLHSRRQDLVHYAALPDEDNPFGSGLPTHIHASSLVDAVNASMRALSVTAPLSIEDIRNIGFRLLFGQASIAHVGRGLTYLLPIVSLGLLADPQRFDDTQHGATLEDYLKRCALITPIALEEPEAHLHPKIQSRLAHWMVAQAMSGRQLIIETHSDHLVRRLRRMVAEAKTGSPLEAWLRANVNIVEVEQDAQGRSTLKPTHLTPDGGLSEHWPADFMDEASDEESAIYYAGLGKTAQC